MSIPGSTPPVTPVAAIAVTPPTNGGVVTRLFTAGNTRNILSMVAAFFMPNTSTFIHGTPTEFPSFALVNRASAAASRDTAQAPSSARQFFNFVQNHAQNWCINRPMPSLRRNGGCSNFHFTYKMMIRLAHYIRSSGDSPWESTESVIAPGRPPFETPDTICLLTHRCRTPGGLIRWLYGHGAIDALDRVYYHLWEILRLKSGNPDLGKDDPDFGKKAFHETGGSTSPERAEAMLRTVVADSSNLPTVAFSIRQAVGRMLRSLLPQISSVPEEETKKN